MKTFQKQTHLIGSRPEFDCWFLESRKQKFVSRCVCGCVPSGDDGRLAQTDVSFFTLIDMNSSVVV